MKKIGLICLALVLALGGLGVGFAMWSETLTITGTVDTGDLDADFQSGSVTFVQDKEVATGSATVNEADDKQLDVLIIDAYPCLSGDIEFTIVNVGDIPAHVTKVEFHAKGDGKYGYELDSADPTGKTILNPTSFVACNLIELEECIWLYFDLDNDCDADLSLHLKSDPKLICTQFDPPAIGTSTVNGKINFHIEQGANELDTYYFNIDITVVQWNEA